MSEDNGITPKKISSDFEENVVLKRENFSNYKNLNMHNISPVLE